MAMDIDKFFKVVNLSTSPVDGEALAAIRKANKILKDNNTTWEMVILGRPRKAEFSEEKKEKPKQTNKKGSEDDLINHMFGVVREGMDGKKSSDFIESIYSFYKSTGFLTPKQKSALEKFYENI